MLVNKKVPVALATMQPALSVNVIGTPTARQWLVFSERTPTSFRRSYLPVS